MRNKILTGPYQDPKGTNTKAASAKVHFRPQRAFVLLSPITTVTGEKGINNDNNIHNNNNNDNSNNNNNNNNNSSSNNNNNNRGQGRITVTGWGAKDTKAAVTVMGIWL